MVAILYFIIYLLNAICIICINAKKDFFFMSKIIEKFMTPDKYRKIFIDYNINIQLNKNNKIEREFLINTSYISDDILFDFSYSGNLFSLNESNLNLLSTKLYKNKILLIKENTTINDYILQKNPLIKYLSKVIIIPKNSMNNIKIIANYCFYSLSLFVIEIDEDIFQILEKFGEDETINIISKKIDIFPFKLLWIFIIIILSILFALAFLYQLLMKIYKATFNRNLNSFFEVVTYNIYFKILIFLILYMDLNFFYYKEGIIIEYTSFIKSILVFLMIINKVGTIIFFLRIYYGIGIIIKGNKIVSVLMGNLSGFFIVFYILFNIFVNPLRIPVAFYVLNLFITIPMFAEMIYFSVKNIIFLFKSNLIIRKLKFYNETYGSAIKLKLFIIIIQFLFLFMFAYIYLFIHRYLLFKKGLCFGIEKDVLLQCFESCFIIFIAIIYIPRKWPKGYELYISVKISSKKTSKINISDLDNYSSSIQGEDLDNRKKIKNYIKNNDNKFYVLLNPKVFLENSRKDNNLINIIDETDKKNSIFANNVKLGKLKRT
jgi:hypothetical protein